MPACAQQMHGIDIEFLSLSHVKYRAAYTCLHVLVHQCINACYAGGAAYKCLYLLIHYTHACMCTHLSMQAHEFLCTHSLLCQKYTCWFKPTALVFPSLPTFTSGRKPSFPPRLSHPWIPHLTWICYGASRTSCNLLRQCAARNRFASIHSLYRLFC